MADKAHRKNKAISGAMRKLAKLTLQLLLLLPCPTSIVANIKIHLHHGYININLPPGRCAKYCDEYAGLSVLSHNSETTRPNFTKFLCMLTIRPSLCVVCRRCDVLCTSGFVDDATFSRRLYGHQKRRWHTISTTTAEIPTKFCQTIKAVAIGPVSK